MRALPPRIRMLAPVVQRDMRPPLRTRQASTRDLQALAELLLVSYAGTVDDLKQTFEEALAELENFARGDIGPALWDCSFIALASGRPVSTALTCDENGVPLLGYIYTHPDWQNRGLATSLIAIAMNALARRGYDIVSLRVATANDAAQRLYRRLGFEEE